MVSIRWPCPIGGSRASKSNAPLTQNESPRKIGGVQASLQHVPIRTRRSPGLGHIGPCQSLGSDGFTCKIDINRWLGQSLAQLSNPSLQSQCAFLVIPDCNRGTL